MSLPAIPIAAQAIALYDRAYAMWNNSHRVFQMYQHWHACALLPCLNKTQAASIAMSEQSKGQLLLWGLQLFGMNSYRII